MGIQAEIDSCEALADAAAGEPTFWRKRWQPVLVNELIKSYDSLCTALLNLAQQARFDKKLIEALPAYKPMCEELTDAAGLTVHVSKNILGFALEGDERCQEHLKKRLHRSTGKYHFHNLLKLQEEMSDKFKGSGSSYNQNEETGEPKATRWNVIAVTLDSTMRTLYDAQVKIVGSKNT